MHFKYYHLNAVLLTENVDIHEVLLYLIRNPQINNSFYVVLTESKEVYDNEEDDDIDFYLRVYCVCYYAF